MSYAKIEFVLILSLNTSFVKFEKIVWHVVEMCFKFVLFVAV